MQSLKKAVPFTVKFSTDELRQARRAARVVSRQRGSLVRLGTLLREQSMRGVTEILAREDVPAPDRRTA